MKGPGLRTDIDVRRLWKCPHCGRTMRYCGDVVSHVCHCLKEGTFMQMMEEVKPAAPSSDCREVRGAGAIPESIAPPSEADFGSGNSSQPAAVEEPHAAPQPDVSTDDAAGA